MGTQEPARTTLHVLLSERVSLAAAFPAYTHVPAHVHLPNRERACQSETVNKQTNLIFDASRIGMWA